MDYTEISCKRLLCPGESVQNYVTNLRDKACSCNYRTLQDQIVRDQFIEGILCDKAREKLLLEPDKLTLYKATECYMLFANARPLVDAPTQQI